MVCDLGELEALAEIEQVRFIASVESDRDGARWTSGVDTFTRCVDGLSDLRPGGEISSHDDVVSKTLVGLTVNGSIACLP